MVPVEMTQAIITQFEERCAKAGVRPWDALIAGGLARSTWFRWKRGAFYPSMRSWEAANRGLEALSQQKKAA